MKEMLLAVLAIVFGIFSLIGITILFFTNSINFNGLPQMIVLFCFTISISIIITKAIVYLESGC